jgi:hypothetical protein
MAATQNHVIDWGHPGPAINDGIHVGAGPGSHELRNGDLSSSDEGVHSHDWSKAVEAGVAKHEVGEKHAGSHVHEAGLSPQQTLTTQSMDAEALTTRRRRDIFYTKYRIVLHAFIWMVMTG